MMACLRNVLYLWRPRRCTMATIEKEKLRSPIPKPDFQSILPKYRSSRIPKNRYDCPHCHSSGRVVAPNAYCDPVEGYKLAARVDCPDCDGKGHLPKSYYEEILEQEIIKWKKLENIRKDLQKLLRNAVSKLTKEEFQLFEKLTYREWADGLGKVVKKLTDKEIQIILDFYQKPYQNYNNNLGWPSIENLENILREREKKEGK